MNMKEIGGYFGLDQLVNNEYYKNLLSLNTGRNALLYLFKMKNIQKLYIPYYLCNSVSYMLEKYKFNFEYYHIDIDFNPIFNKKLCEDDYLYIVNYYGQLTNDKVICLKQKYGKIIIDNTHAFFQKPIDGVDTIYSCRLNILKSACFNKLSKSRPSSSSVFALLKCSKLLLVGTISPPIKIEVFFIIISLPRSKYNS
jgi:hypothetical protein